jgi:hypothetical protein
MVLISSGLLTFTTSVVSSSTITWSYYQPTLRIISQEHRTKLHCGRRPKSHKPEIGHVDCCCTVSNSLLLMTSQSVSQSVTHQTIRATNSTAQNHTQMQKHIKLFHMMAVLLEAKTATAGLVSLLYIQPQLGIHGILCSKYLAL